MNANESVDRYSEYFADANAMLEALEGQQAALTGTEAIYRYVLLVDGQPIQPNIPAVEIAPQRSGVPLSTTAMPLLSAGTHRIQVVAQVTPGAIEYTRNQALTALGVLD